jgi:hypothetical protein
MSLARSIGVPDEYVSIFEQNLFTGEILAMLNDRNITELGIDNAMICDLILNAMIKASQYQP